MRRWIGSMAFLVGALWSAPAAIGTEAALPVWTEDSFEDFADGVLDSGGQNLYVSRDGKVRTIHRFDLNRDGYIDLLFNGTHDEHAFLPATASRVTSDRRIETRPLAVEGSLRVVAADLNRDGWLDLVFCPNASGIQNPRRFVTVIYGGPDGWPARRSSDLLPVRDARTLAITDLNRDGRPDIAVLCSDAWMRGQPEGRIIRVFWGGDEGYLLTRFLDLGVPGAIDLAAADLDGDGVTDLAVLRSDKKIQFFWAKAAEGGITQPVSSDIALPGEGAQCLTAADCDGNGNVDLAVGTSKGVVHLIGNRGGRNWDVPLTVKAFDASRITVGDLDADRQPDLVLSEFGVARAAGGEIVGAKKGMPDVIHVLWGDKGGFSASRSSELAVGFAGATAIGDFDGDGQTDLAVAVYQGAQTFDGESVVFWGRGRRQFERGERGIATQGAADVIAVRQREGQPVQAVFCNSRGGALSERVPLLLYWGGPEGFDAKRRMEIPFASGYESTAADLNTDGFVDLVAMNSGHMGLEGAKGATDLGVNILWGGPKGIDPAARRTILPHYAVWSSNTADLNRDGYLDLVMGLFASATPNEPEPLIIYYGTAGGFDEKHRLILPSEGESCGCVIADFNRDQWLDIAVTSFGKHRIRVFWGGQAGFSAARQSTVEVPSPIDLETADLNGDGWLDLITGSYHDVISGCHDTGTIILWGGPQGFRQWDSQRLPGVTPVGLTVADFDADGYLDLFCPHYHSELTRESLPSYLYWGGAEGFAPRCRTILICDSGHDALAADFDRDGRLDLAVSCHTVDGDHRTVSRVFYNDGRRFANPRVTTLPTHGSHWMWQQDMGHIYHRRWEQCYESSVFRWGEPAAGGRIACVAEVPGGTKLEVAVRAADREEAMAGRAWQAVSSDGFSLRPTDRCLQYRAVFKSDNGDRYPALDRVTVTLEPAR